ncbi:MAG TPA: glycosyltransferase [Terriglobales bacterium]|nr:glycosyltransferase [Terriglobales bacterium]
MIANKGQKKILFATIGSLGDLHPCIALALELKRRGHLVTIASTEFYRTKVEEYGIGFHPMRPNWNPTDSALIRQCEELKRGPEILYRKLILPHLQDTYNDLFAASANADLMIAGELVYAAPLVAEKRNLPWISAILSPSSFFSSYDPSVLVTVPHLMHLRKLGPSVYRAGLNACRWATRHWSNPVRQLRKEWGLSEDCDPVLQDKFSKYLVLALFSCAFARQQPDWPQQTVQPGFVFHDQKIGDETISKDLAEFLSSGDAPIVFTLGSTAVHHPGDFYMASLEAARKLNRRAILIGIKEINKSADHPILTLSYAAYSQVFPHAAVIVHQGGSGTTAQVMRAGKPMLFVPYGWDQPDNAARIERMGAGLSLSRKTYSAKTAAAALNRLLTEPSFSKRAAEAQSRMEKDGLATACNAIESVLQSA